MSSSVLSFFFMAKVKLKRGFSINKAFMNDNMQEKSIVARCSVKDYMLAYQLKPHPVKITKDFKKVSEVCNHALLVEKQDTR